MGNRGTLEASFGNLKSILQTSREEGKIKVEIFHDCELCLEDGLSQDTKVQLCENHFDCCQICYDRYLTM
jgi:hypothetical protein